MINCPQTDPHGAHSYLRLGGEVEARRALAIESGEAS